MKADLRGHGPSSAAFTRYLSIFLLLNAFLLNGVLWSATPPPHKETVLVHAWEVVNARGSDDSWGVMYEALEYLNQPGPLPLYAELFFKRKVKFQYPPSSVFTLSAMLYVAPYRVRTSEYQYFPFPTINDLLGWAFILMTAAAGSILLERGLRGRLADDGPLFMATRAVVVLGLTLTFYPIVKAYTLGQVQVWINGFFALALLAWAMGAKASSGLLIGLMCLVKPHYGVFVLWGLLRREWRFTLACAVTLGVGLASALALYGWANHVDYLSALMFMAERGETYYPNQSANGLLNRVMTLIDPSRWNSLEFYDNSFPSFSPLVYGGTLIGSVILLSTALFRRGNEGDPHRTFDFCTMTLSITIASPIAWEHHYGTIFPVFAILLASVITDRRRLILLTVSYVLISNYIPATNLLAGTVFNIAQSYLLAGAIVVLMLLHTARPGWQIVNVPAVRPAAAPPVPSAPIG